VSSRTVRAIQRNPVSKNPKTKKKKKERNLLSGKSHFKAAHAWASRVFYTNVLVYPAKVLRSVLWGSGVQGNCA
jgi:hypothetical protein